MDKIVVRIDPGLGRQHVAIYKDNECKWWAQPVEDDDFCSFWWGDVND